MAKAHIIPKRRYITIEKYLHNKFSTISASKKYSLKNLLKLRVYTKEKDISKQIDTIVYR